MYNILFNVTMKIKIFSFFSFFAVLIILLTSCSKEYSEENGNGTDTAIPIGTSSGTAVYTFSSVSGNCVAPKISGTYTTGTATTIANTVLLKVTVVSPGTYLISTATINGIIFTGSGTFLITGAQTIQLFASGTPLVADSFGFIPGTVGCLYDIIFTQGNNNSAIFTFPTAPNACNLVTVKGTYNAGTALTISNTVAGIQVNVTTPGTFYLTTVPNNGITFSGSGTFTATGLQTITLTGNGTPITSGAFSYSPGNHGCSFTIPILPADPLPTDYIKCKIDGIATIFTDSVFATEKATPASPPVPATVELDISGNVSASSNENISLQLSKFGTTIATNDIFDPNSFTSGKLYLVSYTDASSINWNGVSAVTETPFTIKITNRTATRVQGTFSGTVSDTGAPGGKVKVITEGTFSVPVR